LSKGEKENSIRDGNVPHRADGLGLRASRDEKKMRGETIVEKGGTAKGTKTRAVDLKGF